MSKTIRQKNPGRDDDWIIEGEPDESALQELGKNNKIRGLEFQSITKLPERPFRHLASLRRLKSLVIHSCRVTLADMGDLASFSNLESLWIDGCQVEDAGVERLSGHPKLSRVVLNNTRVSDVALEHLATLPNLEWLWLDGTAVTDRGLAHLTTALRLNSLALRNTAVTDQGILQLAVLPTLNLRAGLVQGSAVTAEGLDALFAAQRAQRESARTTKKPAGKAPATIAPAEIDAAKNVLYDFFKAMNEWARLSFEQLQAAKAQSATGLREDEVWKRCREGCRQIFSRYCTPKTRSYGRPENVSIGSPPDYADDPEQEPITFIDTPSRQRIVIETKQEFGVKYRCQYVLLKKEGKWLIDSKKIWGYGWAPTIL
jgi:hypothetical protein